MIWIYKFENIWIYKFENKLNGKVYIGQSVDIEVRYHKHKFGYNNKNQPTEYNSAFYKALRKYGWDNFSFCVLEECSSDKLNEREIYYIKKYNSYTRAKNSNGYNMTLGGDTGRRYSYEEALTLWNQGCGPAEISDKLGCSLKAALYILHKVDIKDSLEFRRRNIAYRRDDRAIYQYSLYGDFIAEYRSITEAAIALNISTDSINNCIHNRSKQAGGYLWSKCKVDKIAPKLDYHTRVIIKLSLDGVELARYKNIVEAAKENNIK